MSNDAHSRPAGETEEPLYDPNVATPSHAERARTLASGMSTGTLCTLAREPAGYPYGSFVTFAMQEGCPLFFISTLAEHTKNLQGDERASLLIARGEGDDPLASGRVTLVGPCEELLDSGERASARDCYLAAHPNASYYVDYSDFSFWRLRVESVRYIGGYGRMSWVDVAAWRGAEADPIAPSAARIIDHMNEDHADALVSYCRVLSRATDTSAATMTAVDRYGFEMSAQTAAGPRPVRLAFSAPIATADDARREMVELVRRVRAETPEG